MENKEIDYKLGIEEIFQLIFEILIGFRLLEQFQSMLKNVKNETAEIQ